MDEYSFKEKYVSVTSEAYKAVISDIENRITALEIYHNR